MDVWQYDAACCTLSQVARHCFVFPYEPLNNINKVYSDEIYSFFLHSWQQAGHAC